MNRILSSFLVAIFSIFLGSQITEGYLLLPYWKSLTATDFYSYYNKFGPTINNFYSILTIAAAVIPAALTIYCFTKKKDGLLYSSLSTFFAVVFVSFFFFYFKDANQSFYDSALNSIDLTNELNSWGQWHWLRVFFQFVSLLFLILALNKADRV